MEPSKRISWVDHSKALAIILVVLGHTAGLPILAVKLIYSFHMPLFFFLSGYLLKESRLQLNFPGYLKHFAKRLLVPYIFYWAVSYFYWLVTRDLVPDPGKYGNLTFGDLLAGLLHGTGDAQHTLYIINVDLWFFTCLFVTVVLYYFLQRIKSEALRMGTLILAGIVFPFVPELLGRRLPWNIELAGVAILFFGVGKLVATKPLPSKRILGLGILIGLPIWVITSLLNVQVDMNSMQLGRIWWFYMAAGAGIYLVIASTQFLGANFPSRWLAVNSMVIFPLHQLLFSVFTGVGIRVLGLPYEFKSSLAASLAYTILAVLCCIPAAYILRRFMPFAIGEYRASDPGEPQGEVADKGLQ